MALSFNANFFKTFKVKIFNEKKSQTTLTKQGSQAPKTFQVFSFNEILHLGYFNLFLIKRSLHTPN